MKKNIITDIVCLVLIVTVIGIPIAIYLLRKSEDYGKSDNILKPTNEVIEKKYEDEKRAFTPLYTKTTILPVLTEDDLKKYRKEVKEEVKEEVKNIQDEKENNIKPKKVVKKKTNINNKKTNKKITSNHTYNKTSNKKYTNNKNTKKKQVKKKSG